MDSQARGSPGALTWRRAMVGVGLAQFVGVVAYGMVIPFFPLFLQSDLNVDAPGKAAFWAGLTGVPFMAAMFVTAPVWGALADRYGYRLMVLRALLGAAVIFALMAAVQAPYQLVLARGALGLVGGLEAASSAMVMSLSPRGSASRGMATVQGAIFAGGAVGPLVGGAVSDVLGFRATFVLAAGLLLGMALLVLLLVSKGEGEGQGPGAPMERGRSAAITGVLSALRSRDVGGLMVTILLSQSAYAMLYPILPGIASGFAAEGSQGKMTGLAFSLLGLTAGVAAFSCAAVRRPLLFPGIMLVSLVGAGLVVGLGPLWLSLLAAFLAGLVLFGLFYGAVVTSSKTLVGLVVPSSRQGAVYGAVGSLNAAAVGLGPFSGGLVAVALGASPVFLVSAALLLGLGLWQWTAGRKDLHRVLAR